MKLFVSIVLIMAMLISCVSPTSNQNASEPDGQSDLPDIELSEFESYHLLTHGNLCFLEYYILVEDFDNTSCDWNLCKSFRDEQENIKDENIALMTTITLDRIDSVLNKSFHPTLMIETSNDYVDYDFPVECITIYKVVEGSIVRYAHYSDTNEFQLFLEEEELLK